MSIKSISSSINIILKNKILFSIKIELNRQSYYYIKDIIKRVYEYIEKIKNYINNLKVGDARVKDLFYIYGQRFTFTEDKDDEDDFAQEAKKLFYLDDRLYFLRDDWFPRNFSGNINKIKEYFNQLTMNNSVIILGINNYTKNKFNLNESDISFMFENISSTKYFNLRYTFNDLDKLNLTINLTENDKDIRFTKNIYISNYTNESKLVIYEEDEDKFLFEETKEICRINSDTYRFFYFRDTSFKIPKVFISLFILHPFLRPNLTESENDNLYFQLILFISYLQDEINYRLSDAIRAGNEFYIDFKENYIYIDIYCFSDITHNILKIIEEIISYSNTKIENNYDIYRDYALEILNSKGKNIDDIIKLEFYKYIYDDLPFYNYYKFPIDEFEEKRIEFTTTIDSTIMQGYIYGYISKEDSLKICDIFEKTGVEKFTETLTKANLNNDKINIKNFVEKLMNKVDIPSNIINKKYSEQIDNEIYFFKKMAKYNYKNSVFAYIIEDIFEDINSNISVKMMTQKYIFLKIICKNNISCTKDNIMTKIINEINNSGLDKQIDLIGNRFYYYLKSTQNMITDKHETLKSASIQKIYENLYNRFNVSEKKDYFDISFEEFKNKILELNKDFPNYIIFE